MLPNQYQQFVNFLFARDIGAEDWRWRDDLIAPDLPADDLIKFINKMQTNYAEDLASYSDDQLALGLEYIYDINYSSYAIVLRDGPARLADKISTILSLKNIFKSCLETRCMHSLGHLSETGNKLNQFCYMLWDATPLTYGETSPHKAEIYTACSDVMEFSLYLNNPACIESGLHGLGHLAKYHPESTKIITKFLASKPKIGIKLIDYANKALNGCLL